MTREIGKALVAALGVTLYMLALFLLAACDFARGWNATP